ncbi:MAG: nucleotidyltransferase family protein [bacterium]
MNKDLNEILLVLRELLPYISQMYGVSTVEVFGSYVRNQQRNNSDVDILVSFSKVPTLIKFVELKNYLSDRLQLNVDLVMKESLKPRIGQNILNEAVTV